MSRARRSNTLEPLQIQKVIGWFNSHAQTCSTLYVTCWPLACQGIYSLDWSNVPSTSTSSHRIFTKELSDAEASVHTRPSTKDDTEKVYAADWTEVPGHPSPAAIENWKRLKLACPGLKVTHQDPKKPTWAQSMSKPLHHHGRRSSFSDPGSCGLRGSEF